MGQALAGIGVLCAVVGWIWVVVLAFKAGDTLWGVLSIICSIVGFVWGVMHFQQAKTPMLIWIVGIVLAGLSNLFPGAAVTGPVVP